MDRPHDGPRGAGADRGPGDTHHRIRAVLHRARLLPVREHPVRGVGQGGAGAGGVGQGVAGAGGAREAKASAEAGWTFVEVLIVIAIILILTGAVGFMAFRYIEKARQVTARSQIETLSLALDAYATDNKSYPTPDQGLAALWTKPTTEPIPPDWNGPYVNKPIGTDPWGHPWDYSVPGPSGLPFGLRSFGADGKEGGEGNDKDVASWDN